MSMLGLQGMATLQHQPLTPTSHHQGTWVGRQAHDGVLVTFLLSLPTRARP